MSMEKIIDALGVTAEALGQQVTPAALLMMADDLADHPLSSVLDALRKVRRECRRLTMADIIDRIESTDGRPRADEAWMNALLAEDESATVVWTEETAQAYSIAKPALEIHDKIGARMAFKAAYDRLVQDAREAKNPAKWTASLGWDVEQRRIALESAVECKRLPASYAAGLLPAPPVNPDVAKAVLQLACVNGETVNTEVSDREFARRKLAELRDLLENGKTA